MRKGITGKAGHLLGQQHEMLVLWALQLASRPSWIVSVRPASREEDELGIDVVIETTDVGQLHLQVKSSRKEARKFRQEAKKNSLKANRKDIPVVVVNKKDRLHSRYHNILEKTIRKLKEKRLEKLVNKG